MTMQSLTKLDIEMEMALLHFNSETRSFLALFNVIVSFSYLANRVFFDRPRLVGKCRKIEENYARMQDSF